MCFSSYGTVLSKWYNHEEHRNKRFTGWMYDLWDEFTLCVVVDRVDLLCTRLRM